MKYAIVDIETTGGHASASAITEIAIFIYENGEVTETFTTLINPQRPIPLYIQTLTGIDEALIAKAPVFAEIADRIFELLSGCVFVAHSVNFDYSFIKHHLAREGYEWNAPKLCTVRLSRKIKPGLPSYSLGRLCASLDIPIENRHRAAGDAAATLTLFTRLMEWDREGHIRSMLKRNSKEQALPPNLPKEDFDALPPAPGVYYFKDKAGKVIYVGKARNLRKRVSTHFTGHNPNPQRQHFMLDIHSIHFERCGTELMALLLEASEIKKIWPKYNRALKKYEPRFGLFVYEDQNNYMRLAIGKYNKSLLVQHEFMTRQEGVSTLYSLCDTFGLCPELCGIGPCKSYCCSEDIQGIPDRNEMHGSPEAYNREVVQALTHFRQETVSFAIMDRGRDEEEQSCIWVEKGQFYGMGYVSRYTDLHHPEDIKAALTRLPGNRYMMDLVMKYAGKYPAKVIRPDHAHEGYTFA